MLRNYQLEGVDFLDKRQSAALHFEQGLGKTLTVLTHLNNNQFKLPALIVCPKSVVPVWSQEVSKHGFGFSVNEFKGSSINKKALVNKSADLHVINYEGMRILNDSLLKTGFNTIIFDEAHRIKERDTKQTKAAFSLCQKTKYVLQMTGTPMTKDPSDLWTQLYLMALKTGDADKIGNFYSFQARFCTMKSIRIMVKGKAREIKKVVGVRNEAALNELRALLCLRKTKAGNLELPDKIYKKIPIEMDGDQKKAYNEARYSLQVMLQGNEIAHVGLVKSVAKLRQICSGFMYVDEQTTVRYKHNAKLSALMDIIKDTGDENVIIFTAFIEEKKIIKEMLEKEEWFDVIDYGDGDRGEDVRRFNGSDRKAIFLSNIETAKEGIDLTSSNHVIFFSPTYNYGTRAQAEDRAHRIGQSKNVIYYDLICSGSIEEKVLKIFNFKKETADKITGDAMRLAMIAADMDNEY